MIPYSELFVWWAIVISSGIAFTTLVSIYLYVSQRKKQVKLKSGISRIGKDFAFVWILLTLLILYIVSIGDGSVTLFAIGNLIVELALVIYLLTNKTKLAC